MRYISSIIFVAVGYVLVTGFLKIKNLLIKKEEIVPDEETAELNGKKFRELCDKIFSIETEPETDIAATRAFEAFLKEHEEFIEYKLQKQETFFMPRETYANCESSFFQYLKAKNINYEKRDNGTIIICA